MYVLLYKFFTPPFTPDVLTYISFTFIYIHMLYYCMVTTTYKFIYMPYFCSTMDLRISRFNCYNPALLTYIYIYTPALLLLLDVCVCVCVCVVCLQLYIYTLFIYMCVQFFTPARIMMHMMYV
jgi:hypothetical protein